jgi:hypothetical protein
MDLLFLTDFIVFQYFILYLLRPLEIQITPLPGQEKGHYSPKKKESAYEKHQPIGEKGGVLHRIQETGAGEELQITDCRWPIRGWQFAIGNLKFIIFALLSHWIPYLKLCR